MSKHTHQYIRVKVGKNKRIVMKCAVAGCVHTCAPELAVGRYSICPRCFDSFILTSASLQLARPHCTDCTVSKKKKDLDVFTNILERLQ